MRFKQFFPILFFLLLPLSVHSQFYTSGSDPHSLKWCSVETENYKIIFPKGLDSLARVYANKLESVVSPISKTIGFAPNQYYTRKMPVILRANSTASNGEVVWAPRRMELYTTPTAFSPEAVPWEQHLVIHESRHVAQMQAGVSKPFKFWNFLLGQLASGGVAALYGGPSFLEGDAVVAETALTAVGRGRTADFLEYYRVSFADGSFRNYWQWRYGSQRHYTPDYYRAGYVLASGMCNEFGENAFAQRFYRRVANKHGIAPFNLQHTVKEISGLKFNDAFGKITAGMQEEWAEDESQRAPFMPSTRILQTPKRFTEYEGLEIIGGNTYVVRSGITEAKTLVKIDSNGKEHSQSSFSYSFSKPKYSYSMSRMYWSERVRDLRWEMRSFSDIFYMDAKGRQKQLTKNMRYFHPAPSDSLLSVTEYPVEGGSAVVLLDTDDGSFVERFEAPDGMQIVETVWADGRIYASAITNEGFGIYDIEHFSQVLAPQNAKINELWEYEGSIMFTSDRTGVNELYSLTPKNSGVKQISSTRFGASDFCYDADGNYLYYTMLGTDGRLIFRTAKEDLMPKEVAFAQTHTYSVAESLSDAQGLKPAFDTDVKISETRSYSKLSGLFRPHSWLPLYFNYDAISSLSFESVYANAGLGATVFLQNELGTAYGFAAYNLKPSDNGWRSVGHLQLVYSGLFPVIETSFNINESNQTVYHFATYPNASLNIISQAKPRLNFNLNAYVPLTQSKGGVITGVIPKLGISASNDVFVRDYISDESSSTYMSKIFSSVRAYIMQSTPSSRIYPKLGIGVEVGHCFRPFMTDVMSSNLYGYLYGYLPGLAPTHGIKLSALLEESLGRGPLCESYANVTPRGFSSYSIAGDIALYPLHSKLTADYAMPLFPVSWSGLSPLAYVRNFELILHSDIAYMSAGTKTYNLFSLGADFQVRLGNLLWIPYDTRIGVEYNYNGGSLYNEVSASNPTVGRHSLSFIMSVAL